MKNLILATLLLVPSFLPAEETNTIKITVEIVIKQTSPNVILSSNVVSSVVCKNIDLSPKTKLLVEIRKMENKIYELTNGVPTSYAGSADSTSTNMINRLQEIWFKYDIAVSNLNVKKLEFKRNL